MLVVFLCGDVFLEVFLWNFVMLYCFNMVSSLCLEMNHDMGLCYFLDVYFVRGNQEISKNILKFLVT